MKEDELVQPIHPDLDIFNSAKKLDFASPVTTELNVMAKPFTSLAQSNQELDSLLERETLLAHELGVEGLTTDPPESASEEEA